jgi:hypothetical protein
MAVHNAGFVQHSMLGAASLHTPPIASASAPRHTLAVLYVTGIAINTSTVTETALHFRHRDNK